MGLKFDNHISLGHIITTIAAIVTGAILFANMQNDISNLKQTDIRLEREQVNLKNHFNEQLSEYRNDYKNDIQLILGKLDKIYDKLDRKADKK